MKFPCQTLTLSLRLSHSFTLLFSISHVSHHRGKRIFAWPPWLLRTCTAATAAAAAARSNKAERLLIGELLRQVFFTWCCPARLWGGGGCWCGIFACCIFSTSVVAVTEPLPSLWSGVAAGACHRGCKHFDWLSAGAKGGRCSLISSHHRHCDNRHALIETQSADGSQAVSATKERGHSRQHNGLWDSRQHLDFLFSVTTKGSFVSFFILFLWILFEKLQIISCRCKWMTIWRGSALRSLDPPKTFWWFSRILSIHDKKHKIIIWWSIWWHFGS